ncbi:hypothetical protein [Pedobacter sp. ASV28]|uniref:hypothetical protein n=1 Tax=Pedobacter sp. ASV28 TaxID=2795123 RepID=UPI0018EE0600|nr:hypothetical protein [Pedobacter sp. ASV28]
MDKILFTARYVEGDLSENEYTEFENTVKYDKELQEYLLYYRDMHRNLGLQIRDVLALPSFKKAKVTQDKPYVAEELSYGLDRLWFFTVALAMVTALLLWQPWKSSLYDQFKINEQYLTANLDKAPYQDFSLAAKYYNEKQYDEAKQVVAKLYMKNPEDVELGYYYGVMLLENNCFETISEVLMPIYDGKSAHKYDAAYMMALSYLKQGSSLDCQQWLVKIPKGTLYYHQAQELLGKLSKPVSVGV